MKPELMPTNKLTMTPIGPARIEGCPSTQYHLNELVMTPAGPARIAGAFHDKQTGRTQAIVALEGQPFENFAHSNRLAYIDWDQIKRRGSNQIHPNVQSN